MRECQAKWLLTKRICKYTCYDDDEFEREKGSIKVHAWEIISVMTDRSRERERESVSEIERDEGIRQDISKRKKIRSTSEHRMDDDKIY